MEQNTARIMFAISAVILLGLIVGFLFYDKGIDINFKDIAYQRNVRL